MAFALNFNHKVFRGKEKKYGKLAEELLTKQYLMTIWVAYLHGIKKVYLTRLGGKAFKNKRKWIDAAIYNKELQNFIKNNGMEVYLLDT